MIFVIVYAFFALTPLTGFLVKSPLWLRRALKQAGNYWFGWLLYLILAVLLTEVVLFLVRKARKKDFAEMQRVRQAQGGAALLLVCAVSFYGMAHAKTLYVTDYQVSVPGAGADMTVALLADLHLGYSTDPAYIEQAAAAVNEMRPDLIVLAGDLFDNEFDAVPEPERVAAALAGMKSTYGTYGVWGNHDVSEPILAGFTWSRTDADKWDRRMDALAADMGITMIDERSVTLPGGVQLVGRADRSRTKKLGQGRVSPAEALAPLDQDKPIFVLEHEPGELAELAAAGADLHLAGHTHDGQMFPGNLTIKLMWENACGHIEKDGMDSVVTSGLGVWGPDMRVGTRSEVVRISVHFEG
ncbi:MAG: metallophosphoesterase [Eubacteriales bacterium]|nr:metallophosphoesterase [Eubacteriales bacterium]